ncbi:cAMP-binding domain of CRP or a regulatory subunit of cAMP-dependent protein kinases [Flexibacter flexilis DSM 6793]|uniref:cAMP-binding domain of CRP or a regulatory subunit of cAMP-dependent protein kinases n=1 Tax=Flexibacter flexilis DSM 6793 TaxID=927664 RepID=A0A1I1FYU6_9BACT|nr:Crp/Fnr family transcriptional regulator [Flexibacter flexilis]SFC04769.1 cAMP-binding domain of CRP or a regulatory subunit of cAMP-dependent protein kinases [Flexibacter flexilis DSM 6793]
MNKDELLQMNVGMLIDYFNKLIPLNESERQLVMDLFKIRLYRRRQYVLQEGDVCSQFSFVLRGCLRMYKVDDKGAIHIIQFASENWWMIDIGSFHGRKPSELNIDALEDTVVLQISYDNLIMLYMSSPKFDRIFRVLIENSFVALQKRLLQNISSTAEERYLSFTETHPHLMNRLPQTQIASFLGITPEFLSRLRNKQTKSKS